MSVGNSAQHRRFQENLAPKDCRTLQRRLRERVAGQIRLIASRDGETASSQQIRLQIRAAAPLVCSECGELKRLLPRQHAIEMLGA